MFKKNKLAMIISAAGMALPTIVPALYSGLVSAEDMVLEEIVVTAQKREQGLQDIPIAVNAFSGDFVQEAGVKDIRDISGMTPGLAISSRSETEGAVFIRGIGSVAPGIGADPAVGIYIDGLYAARGTNATAAFFDVERVEVVKGPQGTLFGRNSSAGAISIITKKPDLERNYGSVRVAAGDEGQQKYELIYNAALGDNFGVRVGVKHDERDGLYKNTLNGDELNGRGHTNARTSFLYNGDGYQSHLSLEHIDLRNTSAFVTPGQAFDSNVAQNDAPSDQILRSWRTNWTNSLDLSGEITLTSITGYYAHDVTVLPTDGDLSDFDLIDFKEPQNAEFLSQELRLNGATEALDWFVGTSYAKERLDFSGFLSYDEATVVAILGPEVGLVDAGDGDPCNGSLDLGGGAFAVPTCLARAVENPRGDGITESFAVYGDATWHLTEALDLTFGIRYTEDHKRIAYNLPASAGLLGGLNGLLSGPTTAGDVKAKEDFNSVDPRIAVNYYLNPDVSVYLNVAKGYKSGGLNRQVDPVSGAIRTFDEEQNLAYEIGMKSHLWNGRAQLNAAIFYNDYEDFQLEQLLNFIPQVDNIGDITTQGLEVDFRVLLTQELEIWGSFGYLDTDINSNDSSVDGNDTPQAAETTGSLAAKYAMPLGDGELQLSATWQYSDSFFFDPANTLEQDAYDVWNARVAWENDTWGAALVGENLADEEYLAEQFVFLDTNTTRAPGRYVRVEAFLNF